MTDVMPTTVGESRLQSARSVPNALTGRAAVSGLAAVPDVAGSAGLEARPALLTLVTPGGAPVCEGDSCFVPGAEGYWTEVPD